MNKSNATPIEIGGLANMKCLIRGAVWAVGLSLFFLATISTIMTYSALPAEYSGALTILTVITSCVIGGIICGMSRRKSGIIYGALVGTIYAVIVFVISLISLSPMGFFYLLLLLSISALSGAVGGIIGVNKHKKTKKRLIKGSKR